MIIVNRFQVNAQSTLMKIKLKFYKRISDLKIHFQFKFRMGSCIFANA